MPQPLNTCTLLVTQTVGSGSRLTTGCPRIRDIHRLAVTVDVPHALVTVIHPPAYGIRVDRPHLGGTFTELRGQVLTQDSMSANQLPLRMSRGQRRQHQESASNQKPLHVSPSLRERVVEAF